MSNNRVEVIGVYKVNADNVHIYPDGDNEPADTENTKNAYLIEMIVKKPLRDFDFNVITQENPLHQAAYDEQFLNESGTEVVAEKDVLKENGKEFRAVFFFHYLDFAEPLITSCGNIMLPSASPEFPQRLKKIIEYWEVD